MCDRRAVFQGFHCSPPAFSHSLPRSDMLAKKRRMGNFQEQLAALRKGIARIDRKYESYEPAAPPVPAFARPAHQYVEQWLGGEEIETDYDRHFETEKLYERNRRH